MKAYTFNNAVKDLFCRGKQIGEYWAPQIKQTVMLYLDFFSYWYNWRSGENNWRK